MLKAAASKKHQHHRSLKRHPTNEHDFRLRNQIHQAPDIINRRIANMDLRRMFLEGQNIRNNANEKERLQTILNTNSVPQLIDGRYRFRRPSHVETQAFTDRVTQIDANPANRAFSQQNPVLRPVIGDQPRYMFV